MGQTVKFNGTDTNVVYADKDALDLGVNDSLEMVINFRAASVNHFGMFAKDVGAGQKSYWCRLLDSETLQFVIHDGSTADLVSTAGLSLLDGLKHQVVALVDRQAGYIRTYTDGLFLDETAIATSAGSENGNPLMLGDFNAGGVPADGWIESAYLGIGQGPPFGTTDYPALIRRLAVDPLLPLRRKR
jgi:hypothetical protein